MAEDIAASTDIFVGEKTDEKKASPGQILKGVAAPTTQKRVGRSIRHPPGPSVNDGPGENVISNEETPENLGTSLIENVRDLLKTRKGLDDLKKGLDGRSAEERSAEELQKMERTVAQLQKEGIFSAAVFAIQRPRSSRLRFRNGGTRDVTLGKRQRSLWTGQADQRAIVVAADLPEDIRVEEVIGLLADEIETVAMENHVAVKIGGVLTVLRKWVAGYARRIC
jgi:hypothetical protein